jgi:hypothetical protein
MCQTFVLDLVASISERTPDDVGCGGGLCGYEFGALLKAIAERILVRGIGRLGHWAIPLQLAGKSRPSVSARSVAATLISHPFAVSQRNIFNINILPASNRIYPHGVLLVCRSGVRRRLRDISGIDVKLTEMMFLGFGGVAMMKRRRRQADKFNLKGTMSESFCCIDCGFDTAPGNLNREQAEQALAAGADHLAVHFDERSETYIVHDHIWKAAGMEPWGGCLCIVCLEKRIGRRLTPLDFPDHVFNTDLPGTSRLMERRGTLVDVLGEFPEDLVAA